MTMGQVAAESRMQVRTSLRSRLQMRFWWTLGWMTAADPNRVRVLHGRHTPNHSGVPKWQNTTLARYLGIDRNHFKLLKIG